MTAKNMMTENFDVTPAQVKAARALIGWSQQELARNAKIAVSTVADFEREQRTPVANNLRMIREALEAAGISFINGGAVKEDLHRKAQRITGPGIPLKLIDATDLCHWADRRDGQDTMPELLRRLVRASCGHVNYMHFPSGDSVQHPGWDGVCGIEQAHQYVPAGISAWEIGTQSRGITGKADEDYEKRTADPLGLDRAQSTFIFVTPRRWRDKNKWVKGKRSEGKWADVRAYDADDLEQWLELCPSASTWLAVFIGKRPPGIQLLEETWEGWSMSTQPPITTDLVLAGRDEEAAQVLKWLHNEPAVLAVQAESQAESIAFLKASLDQLPEKYRSVYLQRCLVVQAQSQTESLINSPSPLIIILDSAAPELAVRATRRGHHVYMPFGSDAGTPDQVIRLSRSSRELFARGLRNMGLDEAEAQNVARETACSLAAFRRLRPSVPGQALPDWADPEHAQDLLVAVFAGAWDEGYEGDRKAIEKLANKEYADISARLNRWAITVDGPLRKAGPSWKVAAPRDAWLRLAPFITRGALDRYRSVAIEVLGSLDTTFDLAPDERWKAGFLQDRPTYSAELRDGLSETLVLLAVFGDQVKGEMDMAANLANAIVRSLLDKADGKRWWSISSTLRAFAEAAPEVFLNAVEEGINSDDQPIMVLFEEDGGPFGRAYHAELLWALETLAWYPNHLGRVADILVQLAHCDRGGRFTNRPAQSFNHIFSLWSPQTHATLTQRLRILDRLIKHHPSAVWPLLIDLVPKTHEFSTPSPQPRWRHFDTGQPETITYALIGRGADAILEKILALVGTDTDRWKQVIQLLPNAAPDKRRQTIDRLAGTAPSWKTDDERCAICTDLRSLLHHHRSFPDADWALPEDELKRLEAIYDLLQPDDVVRKLAWLFDAEHASIPNPTAQGWEEDEKATDNLRGTAIQRILADQDIDTVLALASQANSPWLVGRAVALADADDGVKDAIFIRALNEPTNTGLHMAFGLIGIWGDIKGPEWGSCILERAKVEQWSPEATVRLLSALPAACQPWNWAASFGHEIESAYWKRTSWIQGAPTTIIFALNKLLEHGRAQYALQLAGQHLEGLPGDLLIQVLQSVSSAPLPEDGSQNNAVMFQHYVVQLLKYLDQADGVREEEIARLEWLYLPVLTHSDRPPRALHNAMSINPAFFLDVLKAIFKPDPDSGLDEADDLDPEQARIRASRAFDLFHTWQKVPGEVNGKIDPAVLEDWVQEARILCKQHGRADIGDQYIGQVLAFAPADPDGAWPAIPIRDLIQITRSRHLEAGISMGIHNKRGVTSRGLTDGGRQEQELAAQYRSWSEMMALDWPRASALLAQIAESYEQEAKWHDQRAAKIDWE